MKVYIKMHEKIIHLLQKADLNKKVKTYKLKIHENFWKYRWKWIKTIIHLGQKANLNKKSKNL